LNGGGALPGTGPSGVVRSVPEQVLATGSTEGRHAPVVKTTHAASHASRRNRPRPLSPEDGQNVWY
jgi:hypothetical protein